MSAIVSLLSHASITIWKCLNDDSYQRDPVKDCKHPHSQHASIVKLLDQNSLSSHGETWNVDMAANVATPQAHVELTTAEIWVSEVCLDYHGP